MAVKIVSLWLRGLILQLEKLTREQKIYEYGFEEIIMIALGFYDIDSNEKERLAELLSLCRKEIVEEIPFPIKDISEIVEVMPDTINGGEFYLVKIQLQGNEDENI